MTSRVFALQDLADNPVPEEEFLVCRGKIAQFGGRKYFSTVDNTPFAGGKRMSREETEVVLAAMGLKMRRFPCDVTPGWWACYGTESAL